MAIGNSKDIAENKIILLYIIEKIDLPVSNLQITKLILENKYMNYFYLQQILNELCESNYLNIDKAEEKSVYSITQNGKQTLSLLVHLIPYGIKTRIDNSIQTIRKNFKNETLITSDYTPKSENEYVVSLRVREDDFSLINLEVTVGSKADARLICENWKNYSSNIYPEIIDAVTKKRE